MKSKIAHIYLILFPNGSKYVGQTTDLKERKRRYKKHDCVDQKKLYNHLCKYEFRKCQFILLEDITDFSTLNEREIFWISKFNSFAGNNRKHGLNLTLGGSGILGCKWSDEAKARNKGNRSGERNSHYGKTHTLEARKKMSEAVKARGHQYLVGIKRTE